MVDITFGLGKAKQSVIVDIALGGVSISIVQTRNGVSTIRAAGHSTLSAETRPQKQSAGLLGQQIKEAGDLALKAYAVQDRHLPFDTVYAFVHAPWTRIETIRGSREYDADMLISHEVITDLAKEALSKVSTIDTKNVLEATIARAEINGYFVGDPEGKRARSIALVSLISDCDPDVRSAAAGALQSLFPVAKILWRTGVRAIDTFVDNTALKGKGVLMIDMTADSTHIVSVREGLFEQSLVAEGVGTILGRIGGGRMPEELLGHIRMLNREACSNEACEAIESAMALAEPELARIFGEAIGKMAAARHVPNDLVLITHQDLQLWLGRFFTRIDFAQFTVTTLPFEVHTPQSLGIQNWIVGDHQDPALSVDVALVNMESDS